VLANVRIPPTHTFTAELARIFEEHQARVYRAAYRITGNATDAEDVLQGVFLRLAEAGGAALASPGSYLYRAAINGALDLCRSRWRTGRVPLADEAGAAPGGPEAAELRAWLRRALTTLSARQAEMFVLRYLEGYDNREIAQLLETSQAVVAVSLFRARTQLQMQFRRLSGGQ
jgi:RNA polymerase sigma-70 factor (ECF subfamily)